ncbi:DUF4013 domain-containing protein [Halalkalicoccus sp. NIPERK01]|uniref:DUF7544 domain-containing protein n=1 Tax=Halalkalicoccus sp. NIPERK01 TaxID=3053469 RepID=UPI00256F636E|nr:DUF4013 domain-containing protein [Halalkalicoccus sp. NIPERK01]MDL5361732.1 DUF4013 domain-containing protein [Halalkalicoccus sp. NIPERK01]
MALYAIDDLDDAWVATREFLTPLSARRLLALAVIVFFVGGSGSGFPGSASGTGVPAETDAGVTPSLDALWTVVAENALVIGLVGAAALLVVLAFAFVGALMEFVLVESLRTDEVRLRDYSRAFLGEGLRLFGFRIAITAVGLIPALALVGFGLATAGTGALTELGGVALVALALLSVPAFVLLALVDAATTAFVVPVMLVRETGVLGAWRAFWPTLAGQWPQYLAYGLVALLLNVAVGFLFALLLGIVALFFLVPFAIIAASTTLIVSEPIVAAVAVVLGSLFVLFLGIVVLLVQVPVLTYLRYYALFVLGDTDGGLDPIPEVRRTVREPNERDDAPEPL